MKHVLPGNVEKTAQEQISPCPSSDIWRYGRLGTAWHRTMGDMECGERHAPDSLTSADMMALKTFKVILLWTSFSLVSPADQPWRSWTLPSWQTYPCRDQTSLQLEGLRAIKRMRDQQWCRQNGQRMLLFTSAESTWISTCTIR